jgi:hypothetical protein
MKLGGSLLLIPCRPSLLLEMPAWMGLIKRDLAGYANMFLMAGGCDCKFMIVPAIFETYCCSPPLIHQISSSTDGQSGFNREPSITKNDWPSTAEELIFQEGFNILWTALIFLYFFIHLSYELSIRDVETFAAVEHLFSSFLISAAITN